MKPGLPEGVFLLELVDDEGGFYHFDESSGGACKVFAELDGKISEVEQLG